MRRRGIKVVLLLSWVKINYKEPPNENTINYVDVDSRHLIYNLIEETNYVLNVTCESCD